MPRTVWISLALLAALAGSAMAEVQEPDSVARWEVLHSLESQAMHLYRHRVTGEETRRLAETLWTVASVGGPAPREPICHDAARTLSHMVTGFRDAGRRLEAPLDWHYFAPIYIDQRTACLGSLHLDARRYPLPSWLGR